MRRDCMNKDNSIQNKRSKKKQSLGTLRYVMFVLSLALVSSLFLIKAVHPVYNLWYSDWLYLWLYRCRWRYDDASNPNICSWLRTEDSSRNQCIYHDIYSFHRSSIPLRHWCGTRLECMDFVCCCGYGIFDVSYVGLESIILK